MDSMRSRANWQAFEMTHAVPGRALRAAGITPLYVGESEPNTEESGIEIGISDPAHPSEAARELLAILNDADIHFKVDKLPYHEGAPPLPDVMIYVTPER